MLRVRRTCRGSRSAPRWFVVAGVGAALAGTGCSDSASLPSVPVIAIPPEVTAWIEGNVVPFDGAHLSLPHDDLAFLPDVVGDARLVALGENTHGTRDFFEMKARVLRFLVEEMGFDTFGIEATWPEARRLDRYVRTGEGDPEVLLTGLYFWTWRTESVLEMIEWMRAHNEVGGDIGFHGVDMQYPGMALHNVREYFESVDPPRAAEIAEDLDCLGRHANDASGRMTGNYGNQPDEYQTECETAMEGVRAVLEDNREIYEAAGGEDAFAVAHQSLRVAFQFHLMVVGRQHRDESMAENTVWVHERQGPDSRMVLWAHNYHVSTAMGAQGYWLRRTYGDDMVVIGFSHQRGRFTAFGQRGSEFTGLGEFELDPPLGGSWEHYFSSASAPRFLLDLRVPDSVGSSWLFGERQSRSIGCCFDPDNPSRYWYPTRLADLFDVIIHFQNTRPTTVIDSRYPSDF